MTYAGARFIEGYLKFKRYNQGKSERTCEKYRGYLERLDRFMGKRGVTLIDATTEALEEFTGLHAHKEGMTPRSRRPLVASVRGFYAWMHRTGHIQRDPAARIPYPQAGLKLPVGMSLASAEKLMMAPDINTFLGVRDAAMFALLIGCGMRISGLVSLNESNLQFIQHQGIEWLIVRVTEKGAKERLIPTPHETRLMVRAYLGHPELDTIDRLLPDGDRVLFVSLQNRTISADKYHGEQRRISARSVSDRILYYGQEAGIPANELHPHAMRHLYGTELAEDEVDILRIQALLGHSDAKTSAIYTKLAVRSLTKSVAKGNPLGKIRTPVTSLLKQLEVKAR